MSDIQKTDFIEFFPEKQSNLTNVAIAICDKLLSRGGEKMPSIPWFSLVGQEAAFYKVSDMVIEEIIKEPKLSYDENARSGVYFWSLILISANYRKFRAAIAAAKRADPRFYEAGAFLQWYGTDVHPSLAFSFNVALWSKMRGEGSFKANHWTSRGIKNK
jgi:hypothetical protein